MKTLFRHYWLVLVLGGCANGLSLPTQQAAPGFSIEISAAQDAIPAGAKLKVKAEVTNTSSQVVIGGDGSEIRWEVRGPNNTILPLKESYRQQRIQEIGTRMLPPTVINIAPGQTLKWDTVISDMYDFSLPGQYQIRAQRRSVDDSAVVTSNAITVTVSSAAQAQQSVELPTTTFSLDIDANPDVIKLGSRFGIVVHATNTAQHDIDLDNSTTSDSIEILDSNGVAPPLTDAGRLLKKLSGKKGDHSIHLKPGEEKGMGAILLSDLYNMTQPGRYTVQIFRTDEETKTLVKSNVITITVNP